MPDALALHEASKKGDLAALGTALRRSAGFPNCANPAGFNESCLEYAIYHSPLAFIRTPPELGADPNHPTDAGFPALIATLSTDRRDKCELIELLLAFGADLQRRGVNDYTPLHYAVAADEVPTIELLLARGADPAARTRIDDGATPLEEAEILGRSEAAAVLRSRSR